MVIESGQIDQHQPLIVTDSCRIATQIFITNMENTGWTIVQQLAMFDNTVPYIGDNYLMYLITVKHFIFGIEKFRIDCLGGRKKYECS